MEDFAYTLAEYAQLVFIIVICGAFLLMVAAAVLYAVVIVVWEIWYFIMTKVFWK